MAGEGWKGTLHYEDAEGRKTEPVAVEYDPDRAWTQAPPVELVEWTREMLSKPYLVWAGRTVLIYRGEIEGLDRAGFRALLREKLQALGDELLGVWEDEHADSGS